MPQSHAGWSQESVRRRLTPPPTVERAHTINRAVTARHRLSQAVLAGSARMQPKSAVVATAAQTSSGRNRARVLQRKSEGNCWIGGAARRPTADKSLRQRRLPTRPTGCGIWNTLGCQKWDSYISDLRSAAGFAAAAAFAVELHASLAGGTPPARRLKRYTLCPGRFASTASADSTPAPGSFRKRTQIHHATLLTN